MKFERMEESKEIVKREENDRWPRMAAKAQRSTLFQYRFTWEAKRRERQTSKRKGFLPHWGTKRRRKKKKKKGKKKYTKKKKKKRRNECMYSQRKLQRDKPSNAYTLKPVLHTRRCTRIIIHVYMRKVGEEFRRAWNSSCSTIPYIVWGHRELVSSGPRVAVSFFTGKQRGHFNRRRANPGQPASQPASQPTILKGCSKPSEPA